MQAELESFDKLFAKRRICRVTCYCAYLLSVNRQLNRLAVLIAVREQELEGFAVMERIQMLQRHLTGGPSGITCMIGSCALCHAVAVTRHHFCSL